jgi:hypothetical protein
MAKKDPFLNRPIYQKLSDEQCCQLVAMRDVKGAKAAEHHFGVPVKSQVAISQKVKARPDLVRSYWQYRKNLASGWVRVLNETGIAVLTAIQQEVQAPTSDLLKLRELGRIFEILGDVSVSAMALAPAEVEEETPLWETIDVEEEQPQLLLQGSENANPS